MANKTLPLKEMSIAEIYNGDKATYEIPIYQRNYAWGKDEISTLIQDVYDSCNNNKSTYFIGTLVSFHRGNQIYEVIDGQQRLTTIYLVLHALEISIKNKLSYRARKKSNDTIHSIPLFAVEDKDLGIVNGFKFSQEAIDEIVPRDNLSKFKNYFQNHVHIIRYLVPKDVDLNHYFEVMNSRGEQLEKHEIIKARLIEQLDADDKSKFNRLWEFCSEMNVYIQQKYRDSGVFGNKHDNLVIKDFDSIPKVDNQSGLLKINELIESPVTGINQSKSIKLDTFQPIMDFSNFLLIVLKLSRIEEPDFAPSSFILDDKELINEFDKVPNMNKEFVKTFAFNLLKAKYLLDNYIVHHSNEDDTVENNPWKLQYWQKDDKNEYLKNLDGESDAQHKLVHLLSMFEVSFTARQRKNYLFYCLFYLLKNDYKVIGNYYEFVLGLADKYFKDVYLVKGNLNSINTPNPGSFDRTILKSNKLNISPENNNFDFASIYGDGTEVSKGISLFVFNYVDYKLWGKYCDILRGEKTKTSDKVRKEFFDTLGCSDFGLKVFEQFYFSRTRRSLEHFFPTANATGKDGVPNEEQINCFGNFAMIGSEANSSGNNWSPKSKLDHYLDSSGKIKQISVASLKFMIMMQKCKENQKDVGRGEDPGFEWIYEDIIEHQNNMQEIISN